MSEQPSALGAATAAGADPPMTHGPAADRVETTSTVGGGPSEERFPVDVEGFEGGLEELLLRAQRGDIDLASIPMARITDRFRTRIDSDTPPEPRDLADFLVLASRLVALKAARLLPDGPIEAAGGESEAEEVVDDPGARLAEYRLFRAAAEALLAEAAEQGVRSFLGLVAAEVVPSERLAIAPERLAAAFRRVLERISEPEPLSVDAVTFSVPEKVAALRESLRSRRRIEFEDLFSAVESRLEAVAVFLALLELVKAGDARVEQEGAFATITVVACDPEAGR